jgi:hypothetical protein
MPSFELFSPPAAWSHPSLWAGLLAAPEADADLWAYRRRRETDSFVRIFRGRRCSTERACITEMSAVLQLPYCTATTWQSLHENLADGDWPSAGRGVLLFTELSRILARDPSAFRQFLGILGELATTSLARRPASSTLHIAFHCDPRHRGACEARLDAHNVPWGRILA